MNWANTWAKNLAKPLIVAVLSLCLLQCSFMQDILGDGASKTAQSGPSAKNQSGEEKTVAVRDARKARDIATRHSASKQKLPGVVDLAEGKVVFLRASFVASAVEAKIYDVTAGSPQFIAQVKNNSQIHHRLAAGNYTFMLVSDNSVDYLNVHVAPNLSYYAIIKPSMGAWKPSFAFLPVKPRDNGEDASQEQAFFGDENVDAMFALMTEVIEVDGRRKSPRDDNKTDLMAMHLEHWEHWKSKGPERHALKTLNSLDGV